MVAMEQIFRDQKFKDFRDRDSSALFSDIEFRYCRFETCHVSMTFEPAKRSTLRRIKLIHCEQVNCNIWPAILEDVTVDGLDTGRLLIANACAYRHVVLRGNVGNIKICRWVPWISGPAGYLVRRQEAMDRANAEYYKGVDWALDISQAEFISGEVEGIPLGLVRRDPATQFVLRATAIKEGRWRGVQEARKDWHALLDAYDKKGTGDVILIAPKAAPDFKPLLAGLMALRAAGVAEPD